MPSNPSSAAVSNCASAEGIEDTLWEFWETDEALADTYGPPWNDSKYRSIIVQNEALLQAAHAVVVAVQGAPFDYMYTRLNSAYNWYRSSPYKQHAELWLEGKIAEGNVAFGQRNAALGYLFAAMQEVEEELLARCPVFEIHPWSTHFNP